MKILTDDHINYFNHYSSHEASEIWNINGIITITSLITMKYQQLLKHYKYQRLLRSILVYRITYNISNGILFNLVFSEHISFEKLKRLKVSKHVG